MKTGFALKWLSRDKRDKGFTLLEVMIASAMLATAALATMTAMYAASSATEATRERNVANFHLMAVAEKIAGLPFDNIMNPRYPPGAGQCPFFPNGGEPWFLGADGKHHALYRQLEDEQVIVRYVNTAIGMPKPGEANYPVLFGDPVDTLDRAWGAGNDVFGAVTSYTTPDPLDIIIEATWRNPTGVRLSVSLHIIRTR